MKKFTIYISTLLTNLFILPLFYLAYAQSGPCPKNFEALCALNPEENEEIYSALFGNIITILLIIAVITSIIYLIWGGITWIKANGDKGQIDHARHTIMTAMVGLIIAFLAFFIINLITYLFTGQSQISLEVPKLVE